MKKYDIIVIGSGGGTKICTPASKLGYKVAIIEKDRLGGTCLNRGCIPSKMLIHPATVASQIRESDKFGIKAKIDSIDFAKLVKRISKIVDAQSDSIVPQYKKNKNLDFYHGEAKFLSNYVLEVNGEKLTSKKIFIAAGARPSIPPIDGLKGTPFMTSTEALRNTKIPKKLIIVGGGYIGCELGHAYGGLGSEVHFIVRGNELLQREDKDIRQEYTKAFSKAHNIYYNTSTEKVEYMKKKFILTIKSNGKVRKLSGDSLLIATGVKVNSDTLDLQHTDIETSMRGFVKVNKYLETTVKGVYALGDVVGNYMFRHSVNFEGEYLFNSLFIDKKRKPIKYPPMPHAVFTHPEIAGVGVTEDDLVAKGMIEDKDFVIGRNSYMASGMGMARLSKNSFVKLIFNKKNKKLIGAHIIGEEASTMMQQLIQAMTFNATSDHLLNQIYIHPALPEIVRNAARNAKF